MAGEQKGKTYEAVINFILSNKLKSKFKNDNIYWNVKPIGMSIEPDFTIGQNPNEPDVILLVTHSKAAPNSDMKFWRNIGELSESKKLSGKIPIVISIVFDSTIKQNLQILQNSVFDAQIFIDKTSSGRLLLQWVDENYESLPSNGNEKTKELERRFKLSEDKLKKYIDQLSGEIYNAITISQTNSNNLWSLFRSAKTAKSPAARQTFARRGAGKLLLLDDPSRININGNVASDTPTEIIKTLEELRLITKTTRTYVVSDKELKWAVQNISDKQKNEIFKIKKIERVKEWIDSIISVSNSKTQLEYLQSNWTSLLEPKILYSKLKQCKINPNSLSKSVKTNNSGAVWLYHIIIEWIKNNSNTRTKYGIAALLTDLKTLKNDPNHVKLVHEIIHDKQIFRSEQTIRLGLQDWQNAHSGQKFSFTDGDLARISCALSWRLSLCKSPNPDEDFKKVKDGNIKILQNKLYNYWKFKPLEILFEDNLKQNNIKFKKEAVRSCFAEKIISEGIKIDPRTSCTGVYLINDAIIYCKSVSDDGRDHKKKETCARAVALKYTWNILNNKFEERLNSNRMIIIIDGTWRQGDIDAMAKAGWTEFFYPDELDRLASSFKSK